MDWVANCQTSAAVNVGLTSYNMTPSSPYASSSAWAAAGPTLLRVRGRICLIPEVLHINERVDETDRFIVLMGMTVGTVQSVLAPFDPANPVHLSSDEVIWSSSVGGIWQLNYASGGGTTDIAASYFHEAFCVDVDVKAKRRFRNAEDQFFIHFRNSGAADMRWFGVLRFLFAMP